jgi:hypothetical protein
LEAVLEATVAKIEAEYTDDRLAVLVAAGGVAE